MGNKDLVNEPLTAYLVPSRDAHNSEYLAACDERRAFLSGFTGSAGDAIITLSQAMMWTDGRYFIQAEEEMDENWTLMKIGNPDTPTQSEWINKTVPRGSLVGIDPRLCTDDQWSSLSKDLELSGNKLVAVSTNLVDIIWSQQQGGKPPQPANPVTELGLQFAGKSTADKLADIRKELETQKVDYLVVSALDEIAWLLNWRGSDIPYNPVFFAYVIVGRESLEIFIDGDKVQDTLLDSINTQDKHVRIHQYDDIRTFFEKLVSESEPSGSKFWLSKFASYYLTSAVPQSRQLIKLTPICFMKAIKNTVEVQGMKNCHIRDGAAVCRFFGWLEAALGRGEEITENSAATKLEQFRKELPNFVGLSFPTIAGSGPNGAIIHYNPGGESGAKDTSRQLCINDVFLVDSGGQYLDGTTDITRTVHFGTPTLFQKECYTRVLKGQIQLVNSIFPNKLVGNYLDSFARQALWQVGLDYLHGTGHGVGMYLNVHEGPSGISWRPYPDDPGMQENMFMSNEPGYYHEGEFGIRLENVIRVVKAETSYNFGDRGYLTFEDVTMCPIQQNLIDPNLLSPVEVN